MNTQEPSQNSSKQPNPQELRRAPWWRRVFQWQSLAVLLIVLGVVIIALFGLRSLRSFREVQYSRAEGLDRGTARIEAIRPWMTVRYIGVAYAVPEEYIFAQLEIPYNRRNSNETLGRLNEDYKMGQSTKDVYPQIIDRVAQAILDYRANPVPIVDDQTVENVETFVVDLSSPVNAALADGQGIATITDNDTSEAGNVTYMPMTRRAVTSSAEATSTIIELHPGAEQVFTYLPLINPRGTDDTPAPDGINSTLPGQESIYLPMIPR